MLVIIPLLPWLMPQIWRARVALPPEGATKPIERPGFVLLALGILALMVLLFLAGIGVLSSLLANIPVVAAALVMTKGYLVAAEAVPEVALLAGFTDWPAATLPVFVAMMFGATLGGNATLIGASSNIVTAGICAAEGERVSFARFARYGVPITLMQLSVAALYVLVLSRVIR